MDEPTDGDHPPVDDPLVEDVAPVVADEHDEKLPEDYNADDHLQQPTSTLAADGYEDEYSSEYSDVYTDDAHAELQDQDAQDIMKAQEEQRQLLQDNMDLQRRVIQTLQMHPELVKLLAGTPSHNNEELATQYESTLERLKNVWEDLYRSDEEAKEKTQKLNHRLRVYQAEANRRAESYQTLRREIALSSRFSRSGERLKPVRIMALESSAAAADVKVGESRLKHINLLNQVRQLEATISQREELAEGLHMMDFEQLQIENQTLHEKIEDRNDGLHKYQKKTTQTVQILTHIKEKVQFVEKENKSLGRRLQKLNDEYSQYRDRLTQGKQARDELRQENARLKQKRGFLGSKLLVQDFEARKAELRVKQQTLMDLKEKRSQLQKIIGMHK